ncbi:hypothetical protein A4A49_61742, partial [Nicotiana attenuata]
MDDNHSIIPSLVEINLEKTLEPSVPDEPSVTILVSTTENISKPDLRTPSSSNASISDLSLIPNDETLEHPKIDTPSSLSTEILADKRNGGEHGKVPKIVKVSGASADQPSTILASDSMVTMESLEEETAATILVVSADGIVHEVVSGVPKSQRNETEELVEEGAMVLFENSAPVETTGTSREGLDPSPEKTSQGS